MTTIDESLAKMLKSDAFSEAEKITGRSYANDSLTVELAIAMHMHKNAKCTQALIDSGDTSFFCKTDDYLRIAGDEGFSVILKEEFTTERGADAIYVLWHNDGILLAFDTYGEHVNGGNFYYNVAFSSESAIGDVTSSGGVHGKLQDGSIVWSGGHDCREALRHKLRMLRSSGRFVNPWVHVPFLWLNHHGEKKRDYLEARATRIAAFPDHVLAAMGLA